MVNQASGSGDTELLARLVAKKLAKAGKTSKIYENRRKSTKIDEKPRKETRSDSHSPDPVASEPAYPEYPNLIPTAPGEIRNPKGTNQYSAAQTYRDTMEKLWLEKAINKAEIVDPNDHKGVLCIFCGRSQVDRHLGFNIYTHATECLEALEEVSHIEVLAIQERASSLRSEGEARAHLRKTFNPAAKQIELSTKPDTPFKITSITHKIIE